MTAPSDNRDLFRFPDCMHPFAAALHRLRIDPEKIAITLPWDEWWKLANTLESLYRNVLIFDGRGAAPDQFKFRGFVFQVREEEIA